MIARIWKGAVRKEDAQAYAEYMQETGVAAYAATPGNRGVWMLRRNLDDRTEFMMFTLWDSLQAVRSFAGDEYATAVFYPEDDRFLVERDLSATPLRGRHARPTARSISPARAWPRPLSLFRQNAALRWLGLTGPERPASPVVDARAQISDWLVRRQTVSATELALLSSLVASSTRPHVGTEAASLFVGLRQRPRLPAGCLLE